MDDRHILNRIASKKERDFSKYISALHSSLFQASMLDAQATNMFKRSLEECLISPHIHLGESHKSELRFCEEAEGKFLAVVDPTAYRKKIKRGRQDYFQFGTVFTIDNQPFGIFKYRGEDTFLCTRSVIGMDGKPLLLKYGLYDVHSSHNTKWMPKPFEWRQFEQNRSGTFYFRRFYQPLNVVRTHRYDLSKVLPILTSVNDISFN